MSIGLKQEYTKSMYDKDVNNALICELAYFIGRNDDINDYIQKNLIDYENESDNGCIVDEYILFYMFCRFVVEKYCDSDITELYDLISENYMRLVGMFIREYCV